LFAESNCLNIFDKKPIDDYTFVTGELTKNGITPLIINTVDIGKSFRDSNKNHEAFIEAIEKNYSKTN